MFEIRWGEFYSQVLVDKNVVNIYVLPTKQQNSPTNQQEYATLSSSHNRKGIPKEVGYVIRKEANKDTGTLRCTRMKVRTRIKRHTYLLM